MIQFILNDSEIKTNMPGGMTLLDFIRYERHLTGTKIGCREGDCGACTVLIGQAVNGHMKYISMTSCITPLVNAAGKHVVTIEGLNMNELSPVQQSMVDHSGTQCGFCTPGFVVSLSGFCLSDKPSNLEEVISAIDGNICRCTGYKSIERATADVAKLLENKDENHSIDWLVDNGWIPEYFKKIPTRLVKLMGNNHPTNGQNQNDIVVGGGTDMYVQRPEELIQKNVTSNYDVTQLKKIEVAQDVCTIGGAATVSDLLESSSFGDMFPNLRKHLKLVSSTQIRNMGTLAGNFVNASPIGDLTIFFIALNSKLLLRNTNGDERQVKLKDFYQGYKQLDLLSGETVVAVSFNIPDEHTHFNFEKVSKRTYLDIASVNTAIRLQMSGELINEIHISAGGVGPVPGFLTKTCDFLTGKELNAEQLSTATEVMLDDISPISDVRGSSEYKTLLLRQLVTAHFIELFPNKFDMEVLS